jgi:hypothetical protein
MTNRNLGDLTKFFQYLEANFIDFKFNQSIKIIERNAPLVNYTLRKQKLDPLGRKSLHIVFWEEAFASIYFL